MAARVLATRLPIATGSLAARCVPASVRFNSNISASRAASVMQMAAQTARPTAAEAAVPVMWASVGVLGYLAWNRIEERSGVESVNKLLII